MLRRTLLSSPLGYLAKPLSGSAKKMPFGIAVGQGFVNPVTQNFSAGNIRINKNGLFVYNGAPAANNLIASVIPGNPANPGVTFPDYTKLNAALGGTVTYGFSSVLNKYIAIQELGLAIYYYTAASEAGPWTVNVNIGIDPNTLGLSLNGETTVNGNLIVGTPTPGLTVDLVNNLVSIVGTLELTTAATIKFGALLDTDLYRLAANSLATDGAFTVGHSLTATGGTVANPTLVTTDSWHTITLDAGWTGGVLSRAAPRYQLLPDGNLQLNGIASSAFFSGSKTLNSSNPLPVAYQPANPCDYYSGDVNGSRCHISVNAAGVITATAPNGVASGTLFAEINGIVPLNLSH